MVTSCPTVVGRADGAERASRHRRRHTAERHSRDTYAYGILISGVEDIHKVGGDGRARTDNRILLREVPAYDVAVAVLHRDVTSERMLSHSACREPVSVAVYPFASHIYLRMLGRVDSRHDYLGGEKVPAYDGA